MSEPNSIMGAPEFIRGPVLNDLSLEERQELAQLVDTPVFRKAWGNVLLSKPSVFNFAGSAAQGSEQAREGAVNKLYEVRGWELFRGAFIRQFEPELKREPVFMEEWTYPDSTRKG
jgi:hypothetical protein